MIAYLVPPPPAVARTVPESFLSGSSDRVLFRRADYGELEGWREDNHQEALEALVQSCRRIVSMGKRGPIFPQLSREVVSGDFFGVCRIAEMLRTRNYSGEFVRIFFETFFVPYQVVDRDSTKSLFTGYYIPKILARRKRDGVFKYPIYRKPPDVVEGIKYYTREQIQRGALDSRNLEILYTNDPIELYFLHIQGSGMAKLVDENRWVYIGYGGKNNCSYSPIDGRLLAEGASGGRKFAFTGKLTKQELKKNVGEAMELLNLNESYVFFKFLENGEFTGAFGTKLIPGRTMAVDSRFIPLGFPLWLSTRHTKKTSRKKFNRLMFANDVGAAIKGVNRGDIFFGFGKNGEDESSFQYSEGQYFLLVPVKVAKKL
ncbi:MAG: MltA domain-containing protein [Rickettsiales bacterium]|nr:MltA domain-containing protein [Rickettsiales bacterium]